MKKNVDAILKIKPQYSPFNFTFPFKLGIFNSLVILAPMVWHIYDVKKTLIQIQIYQEIEDSYKFAAAFIRIIVYEIRSNMRKKCIIRNTH